MDTSSAKLTTAVLSTHAADDAATAQEEIATLALIILGVAAVLVCSCIGLFAIAASQQKTSNITTPVDTSSASNATSAPTQAPAQLTWQTTHFHRTRHQEDRYFQCFQ